MSVGSSLILEGLGTRTFQSGIVTTDIQPIGTTLTIGAVDKDVSLPNAQLGQTSTTHDHP